MHNKAVNHFRCQLLQPAITTSLQETCYIRNIGYGDVHCADCSVHYFVQEDQSQGDQFGADEEGQDDETAAEYHQ